MRLFNRTYELILGTPRQPNQAHYGNQNKTASPLRLAFEVTKGIKSTPNKALLKLYNLNQDSRAALAKGMLATLSVGYRDAMQTLFVGVVASVKSERAGSDVVTTLEAGDGESAITQTHFHKSYDAGVTLAQILSDVAKTMQLVTDANPTGLTAGVAVGIPLVQFQKGLSLEGPCRKILDTQCRSAGLEWSIQNGALQILPHDHHTGETAEVMAPTTGLLGVPSVAGQTLTFTALLNPRLAPGRLVQLKSATVNGYFKIRSGKWEGDTHDQKWQVTVEAVEAPNVATNLPATAGFEYQSDVGVA